MDRGLVTMRRKWLLVLLFPAVVWAALPSQQITSDKAGSTDEFLRDVMRESAIPGMAVAVIRDGHVLIQSGYGFADVAKHKAVTVDTPFNIASISKPIMGIALLQLVDQGRLQLDADVNQYLPFRVENPNAPGKGITLRELATHTSSIADYYDPGTFTPNIDPELTLDEHLRSVLTPEGKHYDAGGHFLATAPGEVREYSNLGAGVAGALVEAVTGETLAQYSRHAVFGALALHRTGWLLADLDLAEVATPYEVSQCVPFTGLCADTESPIANELIHRVFHPAMRDKHFTPYPHSGNPQYPDGGVRTSIADLTKLTLAVMDAEGTGERLLSPAMQQEMFRLQLPETLSTRQRFFWRDDTHGRPGHSGSDLGVYTTLYMDPARKDAVIILFNRGVDTATEQAMEKISERLWSLRNGAETGAG